MGDIVQLLDALAASAVEAYPAMSISLAYINGSSVSTLHHSGTLTPTPDDNTIYDIGSITKTMTGTLLGAAVASGIVDLSTSVKDIIPELQGTDFPEDMDLLSLATHTSGLPREAENPNPEGDPYIEYVDQYKDFGTEDFLEFLANHSAPVPPPGIEAYRYSNVGAALLGYALGVATGASYVELLQEVITDPLGMNDTVCVGLSPDQEARYVPGYYLKKDVLGSAPQFLLDLLNPPELGDFFESPRMILDTVPVQGAGCVRSTVADMVKYMQASLQGAELLPQACRTNAAVAPPGPDPATCLPTASTPPDMFLLQSLGYAQQRQTPAGARRDFPVSDQVILDPQDPPFDVFSDYGGSAAPGAASPAEAPGNADLYDDQGVDVVGNITDYYDYYDYSDYVPVNDLWGTGLLWGTEDWSETALPSGLKSHSGLTLGHSSMMYLSPDLQAGVLVMVNMVTDGSIGYFPSDVVLAAVEEWWCGPAGGTGCE